MSFIQEICDFFTKILPSVTVNVNNVPYLTRYYFFGKDRKYFNVYLHHFHASDPDDGFFHNHPWKWAFGVVLIGGYFEERKIAVSNNSIVTKQTNRNPGSFGFLTEADFHRVDLIDKEKGSWSLFVTGQRSKDWWFLDKSTGKTKDWRDSPGAIP